MRKYFKKRQIRQDKLGLTAVLVTLSIGFASASTALAASSLDPARALFEPVSSLPSNAKKNTNTHSAPVQGSNTKMSPEAEKLLKSSTLSDKAFADTSRNLMPLTPTQIKTLHYLFDRGQRAASSAATVPPKPTSSAINVNLSPGATPPVIRLTSGFVSSLVFLDATGQPWPIQWYDLGDPTRFNVQKDSDGKANTLVLQALTAYKSANMAVKLRGLNTPVMLTLMPGQQHIDYRVDLRVPGLGPNAKNVGDGLPDASKPELLQVLNGVPPTGSKTLVVRGSGENVQAWSANNSLYLRTRLTVLSPGWVSRMTSGDGTNAYILPMTPVVLALDHGNTVTLHVNEQ